MLQILLVGLAAGAATALLYASVATGSAIAFLLVSLAPLPILIVALGWSHWAALVAAVTASGALAAVAGFSLFPFFLASFGLPSWWLGYLALLGRPTNRPTPDGLEWYPAGHLVVWAALGGTLAVFALLVQAGLDVERLYARQRLAVEHVFRLLTGTPAGAPLNLPGVDSSRLIEFFVLISLPGKAISLTIVNLVNLWLAARIVSVSGRLRRPWPELSAISFPNYVPALVGAALLATFIPGLLGVAANILTASLLVAYAILGFAVLHAITRALPSRGFILTAVYAAVLVFGWPALLMTLLGLADSLFDFRGRIAARRSPPPRPQT